MFPGVNLQGVVQRAKKEISGTADTLEGCQSTARRLGIDSGIVNSIFQRYGKTMQARAICGLLGTTPEALKADADKIVGAAQNGSQRPQNVKAEVAAKFPRLK
nr:MAG TPA: hypothetical protein [Caudoviricetes sp.]